MNIEIREQGIKCDKCDWKIWMDLEEMKNWVDKGCPKCGENVLTKEDFNKYRSVIDTLNYLNTLPEEKFEELSKNPLIKATVEWMEGLKIEPESVTIDTKTNTIEIHDSNPTRNNEEVK